MLVFKGQCNSPSFLVTQRQGPMKEGQHISVHRPSLPNCSSGRLSFAPSCINIPIFLRTGMWHGVSYANGRPAIIKWLHMKYCTQCSISDHSAHADLQTSCSSTVTPLTDPTVPARPSKTAVKWRQNWARRKKQASSGTVKSNTFTAA